MSLSCSNGTLFVWVERSQGDILPHVNDYWWSSVQPFFGFFFKLERFFLSVGVPNRGHALQLRANKSK